MRLSMDLTPEVRGKVMVGRAASPPAPCDAVGGCVWTAPGPGPAPPLPLAPAVKGRCAPVAVPGLVLAALWLASSASTPLAGSPACNQLGRLNSDASAWLVDILPADAPVEVC
mmetsp:Transcript_25936/g.66009  ORF Transcript_25936/g.66009 Transcript_25936/m.66009 type:complete len:113 (-) Transcript_25936:52-390(-)